MKREPLFYRIAGPVMVAVFWALLAVCLAHGATA